MQSTGPPNIRGPRYATRRVDSFSQGAPDMQRGRSTCFRKGRPRYRKGRPYAMRRVGSLSQGVARLQRGGSTRYRKGRPYATRGVDALSLAAVSKPSQGPCVTACPGLKTAPGSCVIAWSGLEIELGSMRVTAWSGLENRGESMRYRLVRSRNRGRVHALPLAQVASVTSVVS